MLAEFRVRYDRGSDVLYVTRRPGRPARSEPGRPGMVWRYDLQSGELIGVTIIDFSTYWRPRERELLAQLASHFSIARSEAEAVIAEAE